MVLLCNNNLLDLKKNHKLNCNKQNDLINKITIDDGKKYKIENNNDLLYNINNINNNNNINILINKIKQPKN